MKKLLLIIVGLIAVLLGAGAAESVSRRDADDRSSGRAPGFSSGKNRR